MLAQPFDAGDGGRSRHGGFAGVATVAEEPVDIVADPVAAGLDAAMVGVDGLVAGRRRGRVGAIRLDIGPHRRAVGLEREQTGAAALDNQPRRLALAVQRIAGHREAIESARFRQSARPGDLAAVGGRLPARSCLRPGPECRDRMQGRPRRRPVGRPPQGPGVDRRHPRPVHPERLHEAPQAGRKRLRVRKTEYTAEGVMARQAGLKTRKLTQKTLPIPGEIRKVHATVAAAHRPHQRNRQNVHKIVATRIPKPRVGNIP